jgi:chaperonin GroES
MSSAIKNVKSLAPLLDRILVQRIKAASQTASGIYIPEKNVEKLNEANVLAVGPGAPNMKGDIVPPSVKAGDKVLIPPFGGSSIKIGDEVSINCMGNYRRRCYYGKVMVDPVATSGQCIGNTQCSVIAIPSSRSPLADPYDYIKTRGGTSQIIQINFTNNRTTSSSEMLRFSPRSTSKRVNIIVYSLMAETLNVFGCIRAVDLNLCNAILS